MLDRVISGGQSGADQAALRAALAAGIATGGTAPRWWLAEGEDVQPDGWEESSNGYRWRIRPAR